MANSTPQEYYADESNWGTYQYISLESVITELKASGVTNEYLEFVPRADLVRVGKLAIREFSLDVSNQIKAIELEIGETLNLVLPTDYINYVRVSYIDEDGELRPISQSDDLLIAKSYLQDNDANITFDESGNILNVDLTSTFKNGNNTDRGFLHGYSFSPNADLSKSNPNKFRLDRERGLLQFNSSVEGKNIVLEYISDGLNDNFGTLTEEDIKINKILEEALIDAIYYKTIKMSSKAPAYEKARARKEYYNSKRLAKRKMKPLRRDEILQAFSGASKWV
jgi:hypothetical protein